MSKKMLEQAKSEEAKLDMTSMIDVVFLLLIFFMCATKFKIPEGSLRAYLPQDRGSSAPANEITRGCRITLWIRDNELYILADERRITMDPDDVTDVERARGFLGAPSEFELQEHLMMRKDSYTGLSDKGLPVIIDFDKKVPFKYVSMALNLCHKVGIKDLSFAQPEIPLD